MLSPPLSPPPKFNSNSLSHHDLEIQPQIPKFHPKIPSQASLGVSPLSQRCAPALQTPFVETTGTWRGLQGDIWENKDPCQPLPWSSGIPGLGEHNNSWIFIHLCFPQGTRPDISDGGQSSKHRSQSPGATLAKGKGPRQAQWVNSEERDRE